MGSRPLKTIRLVPWNPNDAAHVQRMYDQRVACTWDFDLVSQWKEPVLRGDKFLYWIILDHSDEELLKAHLEKYTNEREPLTDDKGNSFVPIGHIALEKYPKRNVAFGFDPSTLWAKTFYISWVLQKYGLGRSAMATIERMAHEEHNCAAIALDTISDEFHRSEMVLKLLYDDQGVPRPPEHRSNQQWYSTMGYEVVDTVDHPDVLKGYDWSTPTMGEKVFAPNVYMIKKL